MIQRIQSIYLILGALCIGALLFFDVLWSGPAVEQMPWFPPALLILGAAAAALALVALFLYKDRQRQRKAIVVVQVLTVLFLTVLFAGLYLAGWLTGDAGVTYVRILIPALPVAAYVFFYLARRAIDRDIALVRSMDRLR